MIEFEVRYFHHKFPSLCPCHVLKFDTMKIILNKFRDETTYKILSIREIVEVKKVIVKYSKIFKVK